jgi:hypothetical protein
VELVVVVMPKSARIVLRFKMEKLTLVVAAVVALAFDQTMVVTAVQASSSSAIQQDNLLNLV